MIAKYKKYAQYVVLTLSTTLIFACGGGGGSSANPDDTQKGVFLDSAVDGLAFVSGDFSGFTDSNGTFTYKAGQTVTFTLGGIVIGTGSGKATLTPLDLVAGAIDENDPTVVNILRFLQTIDEDGNADNGIQITETMRNLAQNKTVNFAQNTAAFESNGSIQTVVAELTAAGSAGARALIGVANAVAHFQGTLGTITTPPVSGGTVFTLTLSGDEAAANGGALRTGDIETGRTDLTGNIDAVVIVDEGSVIQPVGSVPPIVHDNINNGFVIVVGETNAIAAVSMAIFANGQERTYGCTSGGIVFRDCGTLNVNLTARTVTFTDTTLENTQNKSILTINGTVQW